MPSIQDVIDAADLLHVVAIDVIEEQCVAFRNRNSKCRKCAEACLAQAISIEPNSIRIDSQQCVNCGACLAVCPTSALIAREPTQSKVISKAVQSMDLHPKTAVIACARKSSKRQAQEETYCEVPCLGHVSEQEILALATKGAESIYLVDGHCETCKYGAVDELIDMVVENARALLSCASERTSISRTTQFPSDALSLSSDLERKRRRIAKENANVRGRSRRGLISQTGAYMRNVALNVANKAIEDHLPGSSTPKTLRERLGVGLSGKLPIFEPDSNYELLESMEQIAEKDGVALEDSEEVLDSRHFGDVAIDFDGCSGCGLCAMFCPTGALVATGQAPLEGYREQRAISVLRQSGRISSKEPDVSQEKDSAGEKGESEDNLRFLEFDASKCTQCNLCADVCLRECLKVDSRVSVSDLFDFDPKLIAISKPRNMGAFSGIPRRV